ncbi:kinase-like domain-containing protein [Lactarius deliciosus]|nr:kinase-like domain-containing protein [Lactarius deliciosus]
MSDPPDVKQVLYFEWEYDLTKEHEVFRFVFRLYNFIKYCGDLYKFSNDSPRMISFVRQMNSKPNPSSRPTTRRGNSSAGQQANSGRSRSTATRPTGRTRVLLQIEGYKLDLEGGEQRIVKAIHRDGYKVAVKVLHGPGVTNELEILQCLQTLDSHQNHTIPLLHVIRSPDDIVIIMLWQLSLDTFLGACPNMKLSLSEQFLEGVSYLHEHRVAHLDLKPNNVLIGFSDASPPLPKLSIIDFGASVRVESEETVVEGYRGTPSWSAPEIESDHNHRKGYSAIRADRWSCGRMLQYFGLITPDDNTSICSQLLSLEPGNRPSLDRALDDLRGEGAVKRVSDTNEGPPQKRLCLYRTTLGGQQQDNDIILRFRKSSSHTPRLQIFSYYVPLFSNVLSSV